MRVQIDPEAKVIWPYRQLTPSTINHFYNVVAALIVVVVVFTTVSTWPIADLGFSSNPDTSYVEEVTPGGPAAQVGLQVGDHILVFDGRTTPELRRSFNTVDSTAPRGQMIPVMVERTGRTMQFTIMRPAPTPALQATKVAYCVLSLLCWLTGYVLGVVRRHEIPGSRIVALFWFCISGVLGSLIFGQYASFPLYVLQAWLVVGVLMPLAVYIHVWFPPRPTLSRVERQASRWFFTGLLVVNSCIVAIVTFARTPSILTTTFLYAVPLAIVSALALSGWLLLSAYRRTTTAHTRRQIRLIATACLSVMLTLSLLEVIPDIVLRHQNVHR